MATHQAVRTVLYTSKKCQSIENVTKIRKMFQKLISDRNDEFDPCAEIKTSFGVTQRTIKTKKTKKKIRKLLKKNFFSVDGFC